MEKVDTNVVKNTIGDPGEAEDTGPLFQIRFLEGGGTGICRREVAGGERFFMLYV